MTNQIDTNQTQPDQLTEIGAKPKKKNYLNNKDMLAEVIACKETGEMSKELVKMLTMLCFRYSQKGCYINYSYNEDMQAYAMMMLVRTWKRFDPSKSSNPFAFFTECIKNSFILFLRNEKRYRTLKDEMLLDLGFNPSHTYTTEYEQSERGMMSGDVSNIDVDTFNEELSVNEEQ